MAGIATLLDACAPKPASSMRASLAATTESVPSVTGGPGVSPAPVSNGPSGVMLCRAAWGARPPRPGGTPQIPTRITIHHTAVRLGDNSNAPGRIRADQRYHQDSKGWIDIAYHVGVDRNGNIYELRNAELVGDTATSYDPTGHFLVVCEGNFDEEDVTEKLLTGAALACAWAARRYSISPETVSGHRDFASTSCPGANLYSHIASGDIERRMNDVLATGGGELQRVCGPDADAIVAAIEAGN